MAKFDMKNDIKVLVSVDSQIVGGAGTIVGQEIDMQDAESLSLAIVADAADAVVGIHTLLVEETIEDPAVADTPLAANWATVDAKFLVSGTAAVTTASGVKTVGYVGKKRFVRVSLVSDAGSVESIGVVAIKGNLFDMPSGQ
jgi:hypothetical protein